MERPIVVTPLGTVPSRPSEAVLGILPLPRIAPFTKSDGGQIVDSGARRA